ncbi:hypothetical protein [Haladaptatus sp. DFWS20]|uniref:hypothetical protein n=1 Tax=Haladaptatus sp. DFWS20 TaxID=3403467 RepID=UPI003EC0DF03
MVTKAQTRRSLLLAVLLVTAMMGVGLVNAVSVGEKPTGEGGKVVQADGENVSLVFGADMSNTDLNQWVKNHQHKVRTSSQKSSSEGILDQDVQQLNGNEQNSAVAYAADGGSADTEQVNKNKQVAESDAINENDQKQKKDGKKKC